MSISLDNTLIVTIKKLLSSNHGMNRQIRDAENEVKTCTYLAAAAATC